MARTLPHSLESEEALISSCILDPKDIIPKAVASKVTPLSFFDAKHGDIFGTLSDMFNERKEIDIGTLAEELKTKKILDSMGGYPFLAQISSRIATTASALVYIEKVREYAMLRDLIRTNTEIVESCYAYDGGLDNFISTTEGKFLRAITRNTSDKGNKTLSGVCAQIKKEVEDVIAGTAVGDENDLSWGFQDNDKYLKKFRRKELVVLAARPGIGKSSLMRQIVVKNVMRDNKHVAVFTLEVGFEEYVRNTVQCLCGVNPREIKSALKEQQEAFVEWCERLSRHERDLHIHEVTASLSSIIANIRIHHARRPIDMVCIDYLQLINEPMLPGESRDMLIGRMTRQLKQLANELDCVIIILSQLNRLSERDERPPIMSDLRESGNIEQDCDRVVFIYRPKTTPAGVEQDFSNEDARFFYCELLQRKGRNVGEHSLGITFERMAARFLPYQK